MDDKPTETFLGDDSCRKDSVDTVLPSEPACSDQPSLSSPSSEPISLPSSEQSQNFKKHAQQVSWLDKYVQVLVLLQTRWNSSLQLPLRLHLLQSTPTSRKPFLWLQLPGGGKSSIDAWKPSVVVQKDNKDLICIHLKFKGNCNGIQHAAVTKHL